MVSGIHISLTVTHIRRNNATSLSERAGFGWRAALTVRAPMPPSTCASLRQWSVCRRGGRSAGESGHVARRAYPSNGVAEVGNAVAVVGFDADELGAHSGIATEIGAHAVVNDIAGAFKLDGSATEL